MKTYSNPPASKWQALCERPNVGSSDLGATISSVFERVQRQGDKALLAYTEQFDGVSLKKIVAKEDELTSWAAQVPSELKAAIDTAYANITAFHAAERNSLKITEVETLPGVRCWREPRTIDRVGLYVPGGSAPLISTVLMLGVPAQLAGCKQVALCTPPQADGTVNPAICYAASLVGISKVFRVGGAQAIAALTFGTASVPKVDKLFGPGNQYVTAAKLYAERYGMAIDMPAGPSEVMVMADTTAQPNFIAADLLSQAEHGPDSQVVLVSTDASIVEAVEVELQTQMSSLPRQEIAKKALENSFSIMFKDIDQAVDFVNKYAPEHVILSVKNPEKVATQIRNAGSVFLGNYTPESAGDYASGTNHTLPTNGWARTYSGLSLSSFYRYVTFQSITQAGAKALAPSVMAMAEAEGLTAHKRAMEMRI